MYPLTHSLTDLVIAFNEINEGVNDLPVREQVNTFK